MHSGKITTDKCRFAEASTFPDTRKCRALSEEDAFMQTHGGRGSRTIYLIVTGIEAGIIALFRAPGSTVKRLRRLRAGYTARPDAHTASSAAVTAATHEK